MVPSCSRYNEITLQYAVAGGGSTLTLCFFILQTSTAYLRDQWLHSLKWKVQLLRYKKLISKIEDPELLVRELKVD
jgi:hypothetical protein